MITRRLPNHHLVLAGGGHSHLAVLKRFGLQPLPGLKLALISRSTHALYSGMLPGFIAGHYDFEACHIDLRRLARFAGADFITAEVCSLDPENQHLYLIDRPAVHYDSLSLNIGAQPDVPPLTTKLTHVFAVKPVDALLRGIQELDQALKAGATHVNIAVVGGGAGGVELILALRHRVLNKGFEKRCSYKLITDQTKILTEHNPSVRDRFRRVLAERNIGVIAGERVTAVKATGLRCASGREITTNFAFWATGAVPPGWLQQSGLALDMRGFARVDAYLRSTSHPNVFAAGDIAGSKQTPLPKSGVYAVRQGQVLAANLRRHYLGLQLKRYRPQKRALALISTGDRYAIASRGRLCVAGRWLWWMKDGIDRRFISKYTKLPAMCEP